MSEVSRTQRLLSLVVLASLPTVYAGCQSRLVESNKPPVKNVTVTEKDQQRRLLDLQRKVIERVKKNQENSKDTEGNLVLLETLSRLTDVNSSVTAALAQAKKHQKQRLAAGSQANCEDQKPLVQKR